MGAVISHPVALSILRATNKLDEAEEEVLPPDQVFEDALIIAYRKVKDVNNKVDKYSPENASGLISIAKQMADISANILLIMNNKK